MPVLHPFLLWGAKVIAPLGKTTRKGPSILRGICQRGHHNVCAHLLEFGQSLQVAKSTRKFGPPLTKGGKEEKVKVHSEKQKSIGRSRPTLPFLTVTVIENRAKIPTPLARAIPFDAFVQLGSGGSGRRHYKEPQCRRPNGFLGLSLNDRTVLFLVILSDKTVSVG